MKDIVIEETIADMDKNKDGRITLEEYISKYMYPHPPFLSLSPSLSLSLSLGCHSLPLIIVICFLFHYTSDDIWPQFEHEDGAEEPEWVKTEREHFSKHRDKDGDGSLDKDEISNWISPPDYDHAHAEAKHLIYEADTNKVRQK